MTQRDLIVLNSLVNFAAENIPGGLKADEREVAFAVWCWVADGVPVRQVCPHCGSVAPYVDGHVEWLQTHIDSWFHRSSWALRRKLQTRNTTIR